MPKKGGLGGRSGDNGGDEPTERDDLAYRRDQSVYFDSARALGPQVFTDLVPLVFNALLIVVLGSISTEMAASKACSSGGAVVAYVQGLLFAAYALLLLMAFIALSSRVTLNVRWPYLALLGYFGFQAVWTFVGVGALSSATECFATAPLLTSFALCELVLTPILTAAVVVKWFAATLLRTLQRCVRCVRNARCCACCCRGS